MSELLLLSLSRAEAAAADRAARRGDRAARRGDQTATLGWRAPVAPAFHQSTKAKRRRVSGQTDYSTQRRFKEPSPYRIARMITVNIEIARIIIGEGPDARRILIA